jgi:prevent-host-death family protein
MIFRRPPRLAQAVGKPYSLAMTATLSKSQAELPRLVELASQGEDVVITVEGKPKARLTRVEPAPISGSANAEEKSRWLAELAELRNSIGTGRFSPISEELINEDRNEAI